MIIYSHPKYLTQALEDPCRVGRGLPNNNCNNYKSEVKHYDP